MVSVFLSVDSILQTACPWAVPFDFSSPFVYKSDQEVDHG
jgi:hypothetical protein